MASLNRRSITDIAGIPLVAVRYQKQEASMDENHEFYTLHLPHLVAYVVPVLQSKNRDVELGSGVLDHLG
jgi:hypothetical protein